MKGHCACQATGMSSHAIARRHVKCMSGGNDHPYDPSDLRRCLDYCAEFGITDEWLYEHMAPVSQEWALLTAVWSDLRALYWEEVAEKTGKAPRTYERMSEIRDMARRIKASA